MNKRSTDLYPMTVNPSNFSRGDTVKKIITDKIQTPYVGIVTEIIPSTNKVEVQWPHSRISLEDPWDLIKVNPIINPPVVNEDKAYNTYQNRNRVKRTLEGQQPYCVLDDYVSQKLNPMILHASGLYNDRLSKQAAYLELISKFGKHHLVREQLDRVYNDDVKIAKEIKTADTSFQLSIEGNSDIGFKIRKISKNNKEVIALDNIQDAFDYFKNSMDILKTAAKSYTNEEVIKLVMAKYKKEEE